MSQDENDAIDAFKKRLLRKIKTRLDKSRQRAQDLVWEYLQVESVENNRNPHENHDKYLRKAIAFTAEHRALNEVEAMVDMEPTTG